MTIPELLPEDYFGAYMQTYLERDIRNLVFIKDENKFLKFISCTAARTSQEVNLADMGKDVEIDRKTAENWLSILVSSGLVYLLRPYSGNTIKRIIKGYANQGKDVRIRICYYRNRHNFLPLQKFKKCDIVKKQRTDEHNMK